MFLCSLWLVQVVFSVSCLALVLARIIMRFFEKHSFLALVVVLKVAGVSCSCQCSCVPVMDICLSFRYCNSWVHQSCFIECWWLNMWFSFKKWTSRYFLNIKNIWPCTVCRSSIILTYACGLHITTYRNLVSTNNFQWRVYHMSSMKSWNLTSAFVNADVNFNVCFDSHSILTLLCLHRHFGTLAIDSSAP